MLKEGPTGVFQKTLADGLAYAVNLSNVDLQRTNLQDTYLGRKDGTSILMDNTDLFLSDLSYALIEHVDGKVIFYLSILFCSQIKNCDFSGATFREADLTNTCFKNVILKDADFTGASIYQKLLQRYYCFRTGKVFTHMKSLLVLNTPLWINPSSSQCQV